MNYKLINFLNNISKKRTNVFIFINKKISVDSNVIDNKIQILKFTKIIA